MISDQQIDLLMHAAVTLKLKGYDKLAQSVVAVTIIEKVDEYMLDDFDESPEHDGHPDARPQGGENEQDA